MKKPHHEMGRFQWGRIVDDIRTQIVIKQYQGILL